MRLLAFAALSLAVGLPGRSQAIAVRQPEAAGIELIGAQSPGFMEYLGRVLGPDLLPDRNEWQPFAVVVKNNSSQALIGYSVRWGTDGSSRAGEEIGWLSIHGSQGNLNPGAAIVALPGFLLAETPSADRLKALRRELPPVVASLAHARIVEISLDTAIFASGQFVGPDSRNTFAETRARFTAWRDVDAQVQSEMQAGDSLDGIAAKLASMASQTPPSGPVANPSRDWNGQVRITEARQLLKLYQRSGGQALRELVQNHLQEPEVPIHR